MSFWKLALDKFRAAKMAFEFVALYNGAERWSVDQAYIPGNVVDPEEDIPEVDRVEMVRKARHYERNSAVVNILADLTEVYTVGQGIQFVPATGDPTWDLKLSTNWENWKPYSDIASWVGFDCLQSIIRRAQWIDGEVFIILTSGATGWPRLQIVECHRCYTPPKMVGRKDIKEGIQEDANGRPIAYYFADRKGQDGQMIMRRIEADYVLHIFKRTRPGQRRGITELYPVLTDLNDLEMLQKLEMKAAKAAAEIANVIFNEKGEPVANLTDMARQRAGLPTTTGGGTQTVDQRTELINKTTGGRTIFLRNQERMEQFRSERPSVATKDFWDYITAKICRGVGRPMQLVFPDKVGGPAVRGILSIANDQFRAESFQFADQLRPVYEFVQEWSILNLPELRGAPDNALRCKTRAPRSISIDEQRRSTVMIAELKAGLRTYESCFAEMGLDWQSEFRQTITEIQFIVEECAKNPAKPDPEVVSDRMLARLEVAKAKADLQKAKEPDKSSKE